MRAESVLVVPRVQPLKGSGQLKRCAGLVRALRGVGVNAFLFLSAVEGDVAPSRDAEDLLTAFPEDLDAGSVFKDDPASRAWTFIVLDRLRTSRAEYRYWAFLAPVVGLDEGGPCRARFDYLLDLLPSPASHRANRLDPYLLSLPERRRPAFPQMDAAESGELRALVTFGGEDAAGLGIPAAASLGRVRGLRTTFVAPALDPKIDELNAALAAEGADAGRVQIIQADSALKEKFADYDLVVTQFGLTAFEAAWARVPVILASPTRYHERLARDAGFVSAGTGRAAAARAGSLMNDFPGVIKQTAAIFGRHGAERDRATLASVLATCSFPNRAACPACGEHGDNVLARFAGRSYRRCPCCGMLHLVRPEPPPIAYARDYFFDDYKKQYGLTYLEDFPNLERAGAVRAARVSALLCSAGDGPRRILDVGCAYGPFLSAARSAGFQPFGLDPAADAVRFVREELGMEAAVGFFPAFDPVAAFGGDLFDAVSLWYVIEHFERLDLALEAVSDSLKSGGVFAFSTPSGSGISARVRFRDFLERSPADHWTIWEPGRAAGILRRHGLDLKKIVVTGHHPERFPILSGSRQGGFLRTAATAASRAFGLGDTFEAYAVKR